MLSLLPVYFEIKQELCRTFNQLCVIAMLQLLCLQTPTDAKQTLVSCFEKGNEPKRSTAQRAAYECLLVQCGAVHTGFLPFEQKGIPQPSSLISLVTQFQKYFRIRMLIPVINFQSFIVLLSTLLVTSCGFLHTEEHLGLLEKQM